MRERLIQIIMGLDIPADRPEVVGIDEDQAGELLDAILAELREPDKAMLTPVRDILLSEAHAVGDLADTSYDVDGLVEIDRVFAAMIDAVREGK